MKNIVRKTISTMLGLSLMLLALPAFAQKGNCTSGDCRDGIGTYVWNNGETYTGDFNAGQMHGTGTYTWINGDKYKGDWRNGKQNGYGTYTWPSGKSKYGQWQHGVMVKEATAPTNSGPATTPTTTVVTKTTGCVSGNCENGRGLYIWKNGEKYLTLIDI